MRLLCEDLLVLGGRLLGWLLRLLGGGLLGSLWLGGLLCRLLSLLGSRLLGGLRLGGLGLLGLLGLGLLSLGLLGRQLEASCSLLTSGGSSHNLLGGNHLPQGELDAHASLSRIHLLVGSSDHAGIGGVGGRLGSLLGLGGFGSSRHGF